MCGGIVAWGLWRCRIGRLLSCGLPVVLLASSGLGAGRAACGAMRVGQRVCVALAVLAVWGLLALVALGPPEDRLEGW